MSATKNTHLRNGENQLMAPQYLSRRGFFFSMAAVVGALTFQGSALGGTLCAYADEGGNVHFTVRILSKYEVPIMVYDITDPGNVTRMEGVKVKVTSLFNDKDKADTTDKDGFFPLNIKDLAVQGADETRKTYSFRGKVEVAKEGYREYYVANRWVESGTPAGRDGIRPNTIHIPLQKDDGKPYLRSFLLDGLDIQYEHGAPCYVTPADSVDHPILVQVAARKANASVAMAILINDTKVATKTVTSASTGVNIAEAEFSDKWMAKLKIGDKLGVSFTVDGQERKFYASLDLKDPVVSTTDEAYLPQTNMMLGQDMDAKPDEVRCAMPPWLGRLGDSMSLSIPGFPVRGFIDVAGNFGLTVTLFKAELLKEEKGDQLVDKKRQFSKFQALDNAAFKNWVTDAQSAVDNAQDALKDAKVNGVGAGKMTSDFGVDFSVALMGYGNVFHIPAKDGVPAHNTCSLNLAVNLNGNVKGSTSMPFAVGPFPLFWAVDVGCAMTVRAAGGIEFDDTAPKKTRWGYHSEDGHAVPRSFVLIRAEGGLSVGVGIKGLISASIRGYAFFQFSLKWGRSSAELAQNNPDPHIVLSCGAGVMVNVTVLFLTKDIGLAETPPCDIYNNKNKALPDAASYSAAPQRISDSGWSVISDDNIANYTQSTGTWGAADSEVLLPAYTPSVPLSASSSVNFADARALDPYGADAEKLTEMYGKPTVNPLNGVVPDIQEKLWEKAYGTPRMRVVHTSTTSFAEDRAFLVYLGVPNTEVPATTEGFVTIDGTIDDAPEKLVVAKSNGSYRVYTQSEAEKAGATIANGVNSVPRTRVFISEWNKNTCKWGDGSVVDFVALGEMTQKDRLNAYDMDFDVDVDKDGTLLLAIASLTRPDESKEMKIVDYEKRQYVSLVRWNPDKKKVVACGSTASLHSDNRSLFSPRILHQKFDARDVSKVQDCCVVYSYDVRYDGNDREKTCIAATVFDDMKTGMGEHRLMPPVDVTPKELASGFSPDLIASGTFEVACPDRAKTVAAADDPSHFQSTVIVSWSRSKEADDDINPSRTIVASQTYAIVAKRSQDAKGNDVVEYVPSLNTVTSLNLEGIPEVAKLGTGENQENLYVYADPMENAPKGKKPNSLPMTAIKVNHDTLQLTQAPNAGSTDKIRFFPSFNGDRLYMVRSMVGEAPGIPEAFQDVADIQAKSGPYSSRAAGYDKDATRKGGKVQLYQLLEARWMKDLNRYYDFFPIAQLTAIPDNIDVVAASLNRTDFTFAYKSGFASANAAENGDKNAADIYQVAVPKVMACDYDAAKPVSPFASPGDRCYFIMELSNCGSAPITSVTIQASDANGKDFGKPITFDNLADIAVDSFQDFKPKFDENGLLTTNEFGNYETEEGKDEFTMAGVLWPGKTRPFCFYFVVPDKLEPGNTTFNVRVTQVQDKMANNAGQPTEERFASLLGNTGESSSDGLPAIAPNPYENVIVGKQDWAMQTVMNYDGPNEYGIRLEFGLSDEIVCDENHVSPLQPAYYEGDDPFDPGHGDDPKDNTAKTGDDLRGIGAGLLGMAAAATAVATGVRAYEKRRAENEQQ